MHLRQPQYLFPGDAHFATDNLVLHAKAKRHLVKDFTGPLSIKSVINGEVEWMVDERRILVATTTFLVLSDGQKYSMDLDARRPMETCCAFFQRGFVEKVAQDITNPVEASLDEPERQAPQLKFLSRLHSDCRSSVLRRLWSLADRCAEEIQPSIFEEDFLILSTQLVSQERGYR